MMPPSRLAACLQRAGAQRRACGGGAAVPAREDAPPPPPPPPPASAEVSALSQYLAKPFAHHDYKPLNESFATHAVDCSDWKALRTAWNVEQAAVGLSEFGRVFEKYYGALGQLTTLQLLKEQLVLVKTKKKSRVSDLESAELLLSCVLHTVGRLRGLPLAEKARRVGDGWVTSSRDVQDRKFDRFYPYHVREKDEINLAEALKVRRVLFKRSGIEVEHARATMEADLLFLSVIVIRFGEAEESEKGGKLYKVVQEASSQLLWKMQVDEELLQKSRFLATLHPCTVDYILDALVVIRARTERGIRHAHAAYDVEENERLTPVFRYLHDVCFNVISILRDASVQHRSVLGPAKFPALCFPRYMQKIARCVSEKELRTLLLSSQSRPLLNDPALIIPLLEKAYTDVSVTSDELAALKEKLPRRGASTAAQVPPEMRREKDRLEAALTQACVSLKQVFALLRMKNEAFVTDPCWETEKGVSGMVQLLRLLSADLSGFGDNLSEAKGKWWLFMKIMVLTSKQSSASGHDTPAAAYFYDSYATEMTDALSNLVQKSHKVALRTTVVLPGGVASAHTPPAPSEAHVRSGAILPSCDRGVVIPPKGLAEQFFLGVLSRDDFPFSDEIFWVKFLSASAAVCSEAGHSEVASSLLQSFKEGRGGGGAHAIGMLISKMREPKQITEAIRWASKRGPLPKAVYLAALQAFIDAELWEEAVQDVWEGAGAKESQEVQAAMTMRVAHCMCMATHLSGGCYPASHARDLLSKNLLRWAEVTSPRDAPVAQHRAAKTVFAKVLPAELCAKMNNLVASLG